MPIVMFDEKNETPMWTGPNSRQEKKSEEKKIIQSVLYLTQINESLNLILKSYKLWEDL